MSDIETTVPKTVPETDKNSKVLPFRKTTMRNTGSTLAIMGMEEALRKGGKITFRGIGVELTKEDLLGSEAE